MGILNSLVLTSTPAPSEQITNALVQGFGDAAESMISGIVAIIPIAVPVLGGFLTIGFGIKVFRKLIGKS